ncbi:MAG: hypothetical protein RR397_02080 [Odoribacter sp.]
MKYIIIAFFGCFLTLMGCTKEAEYNPAQENKYTPKKNTHRAVKISGTSSYWGEFNLLINYSGDELDAAFHTNSVGDTVGRISVTRSGSEYLKYAINDYIPNVDQDSINRLDAQLLAKHGAGNYHLWDSIPKVARAIQEIVLYPYADGRIKRQVTYTYKPQKSVGTTGVDFNNDYILVSRVAQTYEYDLKSNIIINRIMSDQMDPKDKDIYERSLYKDETQYKDDQIVGLVSYVAKGGESFTELGRYAFSYNGNQLATIEGNGLNRKFTYNGSNLTINTNGQDVKYEFDGNGNVVKSDDGRGNVLQITYEAGNGNLSLFTPFSDIQKGIPYIK